MTTKSTIASMMNLKDQCNGTLDMAKLNEGKKCDSEVLPESVLDIWMTIPADIRSALSSTEKGLTMSKSHLTLSDQTYDTSPATISTASKQSMPLSSGTSLISSSSSEKSSSDDCIIRTTDEHGQRVLLAPLERAPNNVFTFSKSSDSGADGSNLSMCGTAKGWRNVFTLPISYDVNMIPQGSLLDISNPQLLQATGNHPPEYNKRFAAVDNIVYELYGSKIKKYFASRNIDLTICVVAGGEAEKRPEAVDKVLDALCEYKLLRREPFLAIGGGVLLDIAGMAACLYRRGVPFVRVPTTLLAIVDASVGVKNGVDYCCQLTKESYKNRVGSFYSPSSVLLDSSFIKSQDARNISNGFGEIVKLALVRSSDLFELLEAHGTALVESRFQSHPSVPKGVSDRIIEVSIQIMLEELGPNLWEKKLDRCVDYGHTFSKLIEMVPGADIMHGEAVNIDGFFCVILSFNRGWISWDTVQRIFNCMKSMNLPTNIISFDSELAWQSCKDAIEHRNGAQRIPLIQDIGKSVCVSDITQEELDAALETMKKLPH